MIKLEDLMNYDVPTEMLSEALILFAGCGDINYSPGERLLMLKAASYIDFLIEVIFRLHPDVADLDAATEAARASHFGDDGTFNRKVTTVIGNITDAINSGELQKMWEEIVAEAGVDEKKEMH